MKSNEVMENWQKKSNEIDKIYTQMGNFTQWIQKDRGQLRTIYENNQRNYQALLPEYIKAK